MEQVQAVRRPGGKIVDWVRSARSFLQGVAAELKKVTWPTTDELLKATRMVIIMTLVIGIAIGILDRLLQLVLVDGVAALTRR
ncbi:MAG: preprotein translocase subunit SecE [Gemmatimonadota bacterium]